MQNPEMFGRGHAHYEGIDFSNATDYKIAKYLGFMAGCPVPDDLINARGANVMKLRYGEILHNYGVLLSETRKIDPSMAGLIDRVIPRRQDEPLTHFEEDNVPVDYQEKWIPPTEAVVGYALPRLKIAYIHGKNFGLRFWNEGDRNVRATRLYADTLHYLKENPFIAREKILLVRYAENLTNNGAADPTIILRNLISAGKLKQDSFYSDFTEVVGFMPEHAPKLFDVYYRLSENARAEANIAHIRI